MKTIFKLLIRNTLTQIAVLGVIMVGSAILSNYIDWFYNITVVSAFLLSLIAVAFIISSIIYGIFKKFDKDK